MQPPIYLTAAEMAALTVGCKVSWKSFSEAQLKVQHSILSKILYMTNSLYCIFLSPALVRGRHYKECLTWQRQEDFLSHTTSQPGSHHSHWAYLINSLPRTAPSLVSGVPHTGKFSLRNSQLSMVWPMLSYTQQECNLSFNLYQHPLSKSMLKPKVPLMVHLRHSLKIPCQKTYFPLLYALFTQKQKVWMWPNRQELTLGVYLTDSSNWKEFD